MLSRRDLMTAGFAGGVAVGAGREAPAETVQGQPDREGQREIARRIAEIDDTISRALLSNGVTFGLAAKVRAQMESFFRTNQKFPDFVDIGVGVFMDVYDWHIRNRQQLVVTRGPDGRYWMQFMFSTLILRAEYDAGFIGIPYDKG